MAGVFLESLTASKWIQLDKTSFLSYKDIAYELEKRHGSLNSFSFKFFIGLDEILPGSLLPWPETDAFIRTTVSLAGGKGGFGSMLRAIGAQIEKTTNREACRDLSGRRLRDINEEKRLKDWVGKQADREQEREERKKKKLDKLRQEYKHEFHDPEYFKARSEVIDKVHNAFQASSTADPEPTFSKKRKASDGGPALKKTAMWVGVSDDESDSDESTSDSGSQDTANEAQAASDTPASSETTRDSSQQEIEAAKTEPEVPSTQSTEPVTVEPTQPEITIPAEPVISTPTEPEVFDPIILENYNSLEDLEQLGLNHLKADLQRRGLKCGGTLSDRAQRLFSIKGVSSDKIDPTLLAKAPKKKVIV